MIGAPGEINPLPRTPLELTSVRATGACVGITFQVASPSSVVATWAADAPGATCTAAFSVRDAQSRSTNAERDGSLLLDLQGYPRGPASLRQTDYGDGVITLRVDPGEARQAYPALAGFVIRHEGPSSRTATRPECARRSPRPNGEERRYTANAVNAIGESAAAATTTAWAYDVPAAPREVTAAPVVTGGEGGLVSVRVAGVDAAATGFLELSSPAGELLRVRVDPRWRHRRHRPLPHRVERPQPAHRHADLALRGAPGPVRQRSPGAAVTISTNGIGQPTAPTLTLSSVSNGDGTSTVTAVAAAGSGGDGSETRLGIARASEGCAVRPGGESATYTGLPRRRGLRVRGVRRVVVGRSAVRPQRRDGRGARRAELAPPTGWVFVVDAAPTVEGAEARWMIRAAPRLAPRRRRATTTPSSRADPRRAVYDRDPGMRVRYVHESWGPTTDWAQVDPGAGIGALPGARVVEGRRPASRGPRSRRPAGPPSTPPAARPPSPSPPTACATSAPTARRIDADPATSLVPVGARAGGEHRRHRELGRAGLGPRAPPAPSSAAAACPIPP